MVLSRSGVPRRRIVIERPSIASDGSYIPEAPANTTVAPAIGMSVAKSGRTTSVTCGTVLAINANVRIDLPADCGNTTEMTVSFLGQVVMGSIALKLLQSQRPDEFMSRRIYQEQRGFSATKDDNLGIERI